MPMIRIGFLRGRLHLLLAGLFAIAGLALLLAPEPVEAAAEVVCSPTNPTLNFGTAMEATGTISITCTNFTNAPRSFTMCGAGDGNTSWPGTPEQPVLLGPGDARLNFNLYTDSAKTTAWSPTTFITAAASVPAYSEQIVTLQFYGKIEPGQSIQEISYQAFFYQVTIGTFASVGVCEEIYNNIHSHDININVSFVGAPVCTLGTIAPIDFGQSAGIENEISASGGVQLQCPQGRPWTLTFGTGDNPSGADRRMRSTSGYEYIHYRIYRDLGHAIPIPIDGTITGTGTGALYSVPVYGTVNFISMPPIGSYSDRVLVTLSF